MSDRRDDEMLDPADIPAALVRCALGPGITGVDPPMNKPAEPVLTEIFAELRAIREDVAGIKAAQTSARSDLIRGLIAAVATIVTAVLGARALPR